MKNSAESLQSDINKNLPIRQETTKFVDDKGESLKATKGIMKETYDKLRIR